MPPYQYTKLGAQSQDIRLLTLIPGELNDPIKFTLLNNPLVVPVKLEPTILTTEELLETLPPGWSSYQTLEERFIFEKDDSNSEETSWRHPDKSFDPACYAQPPTCPDSNYEPKYEALSYTWGSTETPETAYVVESLSNDCHDTVFLQISQNLASALRHLRYQDRPRTLWADAISINQSDIVERSEQVGRMAHIYSLAQRVVVWLGEEADNSKLALSTLQYLGEQVEVAKDHSYFRAPDCRERDWFHSWTDLPYSGQTWEAVYNLLNRAWFTRLWTCQEIQLANSRAIMQSGHDEVQWNKLRRAIIVLAEKRNVPNLEFRERLRDLRELVMIMSGRFMNFLLRFTTKQKCLDPRDRIYALMGMAQPSFASCIRPHYALSVAEVYKDCFLAHVQHFKRLELLPHCDMAFRSITTPSWVPDWSIPRLGMDPYRAFFAAGVSSATVQCLPGNILEVTGVTCAKLRTVSSPVSQNLQGALCTIRTWEPEDLLTASYIAGGTLLDAYASLLCMNWLRERYPAFQIPTLSEWRKTFLTTISSKSNIPNVEDFIDDIYIHEAFHQLQGKSFITTVEGYIGLASAAAQPGDIVCVLLGCVAPMLLRPNSSSAHFEVVGDCYVHGLEDAKGLIGQLPEGWNVQLNVDADGHCVEEYVNPASNVATPDDPRLGALPADWVRVKAVRKPDSPYVFGEFKHRDTEDVVDSDPRLSPEALKTRGVGLEQYQLI